MREARFLPKVDMLRWRRTYPARTYYVDAGSGSDGNTGLSTGNAWKTVTKVNSASLNAGDAVLFNRGDTFPGKLLPRNGTALTVAGRVRYGAYGTGALPIIDGSADCALYSMTDKHFIRFENIDFAGSAGSVVSTIMMWNVHDIQFYNCKGRDSAVKNGMSLAGCYNIWVDSCQFDDNYANGFLDASTTDYNIFVTNSSADGNGTELGDHGFYIAGGVTCDGCTATNNLDGGFKLNDNETASSYYPVVKNSTAHHNANGFILTHKNLSIYNNLSYSNSESNAVILGNQWGGYNIIHNTFGNGTNATYRCGLVFSAGVAPNSVIKNNIIYQDLAVVTRGPIWFADAASAAAYPAMMDYNTYYMNGSLTDTKFCSSNGTTQSWNAFLASGAEPHGTYLTSLPHFTTRYTDLAPYLGNLSSLGITIAGHETDMNGAVRPAHPTPGAYCSSGVLPIVAASANLPNKNILEVTLNHTVYASSYSAGWTIKENGVSKNIASAARQADKSKIFFAMAADFVAGTTITAEYAAASGNLKDEYNEITVSNIAAFTATNNIVTVVLSKNFEDSTNQGATVSDADGHLTVTAGAALNGTTRGINLNLADNNTMTWTWNLSTPSVTGVNRARVFLDPNSCAMGANNTFYLLEMLNSASADCGGIEINYNSGYDVRAYIYDDAAGFTEANRSYFSDAPHRIEVNLTRASTAVSSDGRIDVWVDGAGLQSITGKDNWDRFDQLKAVLIGAAGVDTGTRGSMFLDELVVNNTGLEIGA